MDIALKKVELIEWLVKLQDEKIIQRIETIKKGSAQGIYEQQMPKTREEIQARLDQAEKDIIAGNVHTQEEVESYFKAKLGRRQLQNHL